MSEASNRDVPFARVEMPDGTVLEFEGEIAREIAGLVIAELRGDISPARIDQGWSEWTTTKPKPKD